MASVLAACAPFGIAESEPGPSAPPLTGEPADDGLVFEPIATRAFVVQGSVAKLPVRIKRGKHFRQAFDVAIAKLPPAVTAEPLHLADDQVEAELTLQVAGDARQGTADLELAVGGEKTSLPIFVRGPAGSLDTTFAGGAGSLTVFPKMNAIPVDLMLHADDAFMVVGNCAVEGEVACLARFAGDGAIDTTFGQAGRAKHPYVRTPTAAIEDARGNLLVAGNGAGFATLGRMLPEGVVDPTFGNKLVGPGASKLVPPTGSAGPVRCLAETPSGALFAAYDDTQVNGRFVGILKVRADGGIEPEFGVGGFTRGSWSAATKSAPTGMLVRANGAVVIAGTWSSPQSEGWGVFQVRPDKGTYDRSFGASGSLVWTRATSPAPVAPGIVELADGRLVTAVGLPTPNLASIAADGSNLDTTFGRGDGLSGALAASGEPAHVLRQADGKLLAVLQGDHGAEIVRVLNTGAVDESFGVRGHAFANVPGKTTVAYRARIQQDRRIVVLAEAHDAVGRDAVVLRFWP